MPVPHAYTATDGTVTWRVRFRCNGVNRSETFATRPEADRFCEMVKHLGAARAVAELDREAEERAEPTLDEWAERHHAALTGITDGTRVSYERIYARTWGKSLGNRRLSSITHEDVSTALNQLSGSDKTIRNAWGVLAGLMKGALRARLIIENPCEGVRLPRRTEHETAEHRYLNPEEFAQLLDALPVYWHPLVWMLAGTGMRWGEAAALTVGDVDLNGGPLGPVVRITKAEKWDASKAVRVVGPTKTKKSRRTVTLPNEVVDAVEPLLDGRKRTERLFLPPRSGPLRHKTFYTDVWIKAAVAVPEPRPRIHDLRHSHVAWLIAAGVPLPVIQARLGHEKITTTIDTYGHLLPDLQRAAAEAASLVFARMPKEIGPS